MADTIVITCPQCKSQLRGPADLGGKKVRCKGCGTTFVASVPSAGAARGPTPSSPASKGAASPKASAPVTAGRPEQSPKGADTKRAPAEASEPAATPAKGASEKAIWESHAAEELAKPYRVEAADVAPRCPHCAEELEDRDAIICLKCGYNSQTRTFVTTRVVYQTTSADRFQWLLPGFLCVFLILVLIAFDVWFLLGLRSAWARMDENLETSSFSRGIRLWVVLPTLFAMWLAGRFAVRRLILNPKPPEVLKD